MKRMTCVGLLTLLMAMWGSAATASHWVQIGTREDGIWSTDVDSIQRGGNIVKVWERVKGNENRKMLIAFDCANRTSDILYIINTDTSGILDLTSPKLQAFIPVVPDTVYESGYNFVCKK